MSTEHQLLVSLLKKLKADALVLPTLPEVAMRVQEVVSRPDSSLKQVGDIIGQDAAISARIIKVANSALYSRGNKAENISAAVNRIGLVQIKSITTSVAMEQLFISTNEMVWEVMDEVWQQARAQMKSGSLLISNSFAVPGVTPDQVIELNDWKNGKLLLWRM